MLNGLGGPPIDPKNQTNANGFPVTFQSGEKSISLWPKDR